MSYEPFSGIIHKGWICIVGDIGVEEVVCVTIHDDLVAGQPNVFTE